VGNKGTRLPWFGNNPNATPPGPGDYQARKPYPQYGSFGFVDSTGTSTYNALQVRWDRRFAGGLLLRANYTWSKTVIIGEDSLYGPGQGFSGVQDQQCLRCEKGPALFDVPHRFVLTYIWQIPSGTLKGFARHAFGGWELSGTTVFQGGAPYTVRAPLARPNGDAAVRPILVGDWRVPEMTWERQFNTAAFVTPADYMLGNLGQRTQRMGGLNQFDVAFMKNFFFTEKHRLQFRGEFYNLFNHPTFGLPDRDVGSPRFGLVSSSLQRARNIQLGLKYLF
jgi:hypothetical protein